MKIEKPIFIIGIQRSGTTILDNLFTRHKDVAFLEVFSSVFYKKKWMFRFLPLLLKMQKWSKGANFRPTSTEGRVWRRYFHEIEYLDESNLNEEIKNYYYSVILAELKAFKAKRFVNKNPTNCLRIKWINAMFPDAYYIIIWRNPRAVVNSIYQKMKSSWDYEFGHSYEHGYRGYVSVKEKFGENLTKLESCIKYYHFLKSNLLKDLPIIKQRTIETTYEKFALNTSQELKKLYEFTGLSWYNELSKIIPSSLDLSTNQKWKKLPPEELKILTNNLKEYYTLDDIKKIE